MDVLEANVAVLWEATQLIDNGPLLTSALLAKVLAHALDIFRALKFCMHG